MVIPQHSICTNNDRVTFTPSDYLSRHFTKVPWSPVIYKGDYREKKNFSYADWLVLDFDGGVSLNDIVNRYCDQVHLIGTTRSHQRPKHGVVDDRFRLCLLFEHRITDRRTYHYNVERRVFAEEADPQCIGASTYFYPCTEIVSTLKDVEAYRADVLTPPASYQEPGCNSTTLTPHNRLPSWLTPYLHDEVVPCGERDITLFKILKDLKRLHMNQGDAVAFVIDRVTFEHDPTEVFDEDVIIKKANYVWRRFNVK